MKESFLSKELQALQPSSQPEVVQCSGHPRTLTKQWQTIWLRSRGLTFRAGLSAREVLPVPHGLSVHSLSAKVSPAPATGATCHSASHFQLQTAPALAARSVLHAWCQRGLVGVSPPLKPLAIVYHHIQSTHSGLGFIPYFFGSVCSPLIEW